MIRLLLLAALAGIVAYAVWRWRRDRQEDTLARARSAFFLVSPMTPDRGPPSSGMRTVSLDGGVLLRLPASWTEEPAMNAFAARASSGRLFRASVRRRAAPGGRLAALKNDLESSPEGREGRLDVLGDDRVLLKHVRDGTAGSGPGLTYCWTLGVARPGDTAVMAELSFSVPLAAADAITLDDLALLDREIRAAQA